MPSVYIETTVIGHICGRMLSGTIVAARQQSCRLWWAEDAAKHQLFVSQLVIDECSAGDPDAAAERLEVLRGIELLSAPRLVDDLAEMLIDEKVIPATEPRDAFHVAIAAVHGLDYLLTLNFRHIANATLRKKMDEVCRRAGYRPSHICTPDELLGIDDGMGPYQ